MSQKAARFSGFYLHLKPMQGELDHLIWQFCSQLLKGLDMYNDKACRVLIDKKEVQLTESLMELSRKPPPNPFIRDAHVEFILFRGDYIKAFQDGFVIYTILGAILDAYKLPRAEIKAQYELYKKENKSNPYLRASYWYIGQKFINRLPAEYQIAFSVDCLLYGEWRCDHPNLVGLHLLVLTWMMGVQEFEKFIFIRLRPHRVIKTPAFAEFLKMRNIQLKLDPEAAIAANAANDAKVAKAATQVNSQKKEVAKAATQVNSQKKEVAKAATQVNSQKKEAGKSKK